MDSLGSLEFDPHVTDDPLPGFEQEQSSLSVPARPTSDKRGVQLWGKTYAGFFRLSPFSTSHGLSKVCKLWPPRRMNKHMDSPGKRRPGTPYTKISLKDAGDFRLRRLLSRAQRLKSAPGKLTSSKGRRVIFRAPANPCVSSSKDSGSSSQKLSSIARKGSLLYKLKGQCSRPSYRLPLGQSYNTAEAGSTNEQVTQLMMTLKTLGIDSTASEDVIDSIASEDGMNWETI